MICGVEEFQSHDKNAKDTLGSRTGSAQNAWQCVNRRHLEGSLTFLRTELPPEGKKDEWCSEEVQWS